MCRFYSPKMRIPAALLFALLIPALRAQTDPAAPPVAPATPTDAGAAAPAPAAAPTTEAGAATDDSVVRMDKYIAAGETDPNGFAPQPNNVFGLEKTALDTPRSVSEVSADMIEKFNIGNMTDLERFTPSSYTSFSFGVQSGLSIRGDSADMYYNGMKLVNNANNLPTPLGPSDGITIVRGPPSAAYGEGLVGGYIDYLPKSALAASGEYLTAIEGKATYTADDLGGNVATLEFGGPLTIFGHKAGFYVYDQDTDSNTWYTGQHVRDETFQGTLTVDLARNIRFETSIRFYNHNGTGIAGWNRVTQALIDNGTYQTGMENLSLINPGGQNDNYASRVQLYDSGISNALDIGPGAKTIAAQVAPGTNAYGQLGTNPTGPLALVTDVGTTTLSPRNVLLERVNQGDDYIWSSELVDKITPDLILKDNLFFEHQNYHKFSDISYFREGITSMVEDRVTLQWTDRQLPSWMTLTDVAAINSRFLETQDKSGNVFQIFNYWDLTEYPNGVYNFANGFISPTVAGVDSNALSQHEETGAGNVLDMGFFGKLDLTVGMRYDYVNARLDNYPGYATSGNVLAPSVVVPLVKGYAKAASLTSASLTYKIFDWLSAYVTYATPDSVVPGGTGGLSTAQIQTQILTPSKLQESGIKAQLFDKKLYIAFANYNELRTAFNANLYGTGDGGLSQTKREGEEIELRWVPTSNLSLSGAASWIEEYTSPVLAGFTSTNQGQSGLTPILYYYGGKYSYGYVGTNQYAYAAAPQRQVSFFGDYIFGKTGWDWSAGMSRTDGYWADNINDIFLPKVLQFSTDIGYRTKSWEYRLSGANLTNQIGFYPTNGGGAVIPMPGRVITGKVTYKF